jgi:hypothetical protein
LETSPFYLDKIPAFFKVKNPWDFSSHPSTEASRMDMERRWEMIVEVSHDPWLGFFGFQQQKNSGVSPGKMIPGLVNVYITIENHNF